MDSQGRLAVERIFGLRSKEHEGNSHVKIWGVQGPEVGKHFTCFKSRRKDGQSLAREREIPG